MSPPFERLDAVGANVVGAMLNRAALDRHTDSYLPYYHRGHQAYYSPREDSVSQETPGVDSSDHSPGPGGPQGIGHADGTPHWSPGIASGDGGADPRA